MLRKHSIKEGFTIIEVVIVLVIAAIIMLAVFLVVPQLQTSQRNTKRQADARAVLAAISQYQANNQGASPAAGTDGTPITSITGPKKDPSSNTNYNYVIQTGPTPAASTTAGTITIATGGTKCNGNVFAAGTGSAVVVAVEPTNTTFCVSDSQ